MKLKLPNSLAYCRGYTHLLGETGTLEWLFHVTLYPVNMSPRGHTLYEGY